MTISVETFGADPNRRANVLPGARPDDLPISAAVYDTSVGYGKTSVAVVEALYEAVKKLEDQARNSG
ncbi:hypothetical protein [Nocardia salmonicida]|uniref:hypothetical protein n=1 Tax=Nocardia salmonicida TaxID=53431 RepID=UPI00379DD91E